MTPKLPIPFLARPDVSWQSLETFLALRSSDPLLLRSVSGAYAPDSWFFLYRLIEAEQDYWRILLSECAIPGTALVFDDTMGALTQQLMAKGYRVTCVVPTEDHKRLTQLMVAHSHILTVEEWWGTSRRPHGLLVAYRSELFRAALDIGSPAFFSALLASVEMGGSLVLVDANFFSYLRLRKARRLFGRGSRLGLLAKMLASRGFSVRKLIGVNPINAALAPPADVSSAGVRPVAEVSGLRTWLVNRIRSWMPPVGLLIADNSGATPLVLQVAQAAMQAVSSTPAASPLIVKRLISGNGGVGICICGSAGNLDRDVVVRAAESALGRSHQDRNYQALLSLESRGLGRYAPRPMLSETFNGVHFTVEGCIPGRPLDDTVDDHSVGAAHTVFDFWIPVQKKNAQWLEMTSARYESIASPLFESVLTWCTKDEAEVVKRIENGLRQHFIGRFFWFSIIHGDLKVSNAVATDSGSLSGIIDWDGYSEAFFPVVDFLVFGIYRFQAEFGVPHFEAFVRCFVNREISGIYSLLEEKYISEFSYTLDDLFYIYVLGWLRVISGHFTGAYKTHASRADGVFSWSMDAILRAMESLHQ